jgi:hypothetical protein
VEAFGSGACRQTLLEDSTVDSGPQPGKNPTVRFGVHDHPRFGLASVRRDQPSGLSVVRVHLHRQILRRVEEFEEQWELVQRIMASQELTTRLAHKRLQRAAGERSAGDEALMLTVIDHLPALRDRFALGRWLAEELDQAASAPQIVLKYGSETEWLIERHIRLQDLRDRCFPS